MQSGVLREYTRDETIDNFLRNIHDIKLGFESKEKKPLDKFGKLNGILIAMGVISMIDDKVEDGDVEKSSTKLPKVRPSISLIQVSNGANISNGLRSNMSCWAFPPELKSEFEKNRLDLRTQIGFLTKVKEFIDSYHQNEIATSDELVTDILSLIDKGFDGYTFRLEANSSQEDRDKCIAYGMRYYPQEGYNIAGNLAARYKELYPSKRTKLTDNRELD